MLRRILLVILIAAIIVGALGYLKYRQIQQAIAMYSQPQPLATVTAARVEAIAWRPELRAVGTVTAVQGVMVNNETPGQVKRIFFKSGDMVEQGQALVQLDTAVDDAELDGLQAARGLAETQLERNRRLLAERAVSQGDFDEASARLQQAEAQVAGKRALIEKKTIRAPFAGQLGIREVNLGQYLDVGSSIVGLEALDPVYVDYALPEREMAALAVGQNVRVTVSAYPERTFTGRLQAISPAIDKGSRNVKVRALFDNAEHLLRPGMFAKVATVLPAQDNVLVLPRQAITFNTYGDSVFLITPGEGEQDGQSVVQRRQIETAAVHGDGIVITAGLKQGDRVVQSGQVKLRNGMAVSISEENTPTEARQ